MYQTEVLLMAVALGLYLYDSALLLHRNEAVLAYAGRSRWRAAFGSRHGTVFGKELLVPNPLLPARPLFRLVWRMEAEPSATPERLDQAPAVLLRPFAPLVISLGLAMFLWLPLVLFLRLGDLLILLAFALIYLQVIALALMLAGRRRLLGLPWRRVAALVAEMLLCPPCALNLVRRLSLSTPVAEDFVTASRRLLDAARWGEAREQIHLRLEDEMAGEPEGSARMAVLDKRLTVLQTIPTESSDISDC